MMTPQKQAEQTRDAAQAEATKKTNLAREAADELGRVRRLHTEDRKALDRVQHLVEEARNERNAAEQEAKRLAACLEGARATSDAWRGQAKAGDAAVQILRSVEVARTIETLQAEIDRLRAEVDRRRSK